MSNWFEAKEGDAPAAQNKLMRQSAVMMWTVAGLMVVGLVWAFFAELDEVATGEGKVVPSSREQVIQSLEGGIVASIHVKPDQIVNPGEILMQLDPTQAGSTVEESAAKYRAALAATARLRAEANDMPLRFSEELNEFPELKAEETQLYHSRKARLSESLRLIDDALALVTKEVQIGESLIDVGASSNVEVLRLKRQRSELQLKKADLQSQYMVEARESLARADEQVEALAPVVRGRNDTLNRLTVRSPVRGIVRNVEVSTVGGVVSPNGKIMDIIPLDDNLLVEARISPRDVAFIHPGQRATVKVTAYDYAVYGGLEGEVVSISPDTIRDEVKREVVYYRAYIRTKSDALVNKAGKKFPITPGMVTTVDVHTGSKTVLAYLLKPLNKAREAMRER